MQDFEKLGVFYLGRHHDPATRSTGESPVLYDSRDLVTHAAIIGITGSGKTGLGLDLLEEAAIDGVPAIAIDPKGDLGNLLLAFPDLSPASFRPWVDPAEAARKQMSVDDFAASQAETWRTGLARWGQDGARIQRLGQGVGQLHGAGFSLGRWATAIMMPERLRRLMAGSISIGAWSTQLSW